MREVRCARCGKKIEYGRVVYVTVNHGTTTSSTFSLAVCLDCLRKIMKDDC